MKTRLTTLSALLAILAVPLGAHAQGKVGVININAAIASTAEGKKAIADLQQKYQPRQQELERLQGEIQSIQGQLSKTPAPADDEQRRLTRDLEDKQKTLKRMTDDAQSDFNNDRDEAIRRIGQKMVRVIQEYAPQNGIVLVIDGIQVPIYYASKDLDITEAIVKRYDAANPVAGAVAPAAHAPASSSATKPK
jgi:Skp family chaperone for outer membrane proteins